MSSKLLLNYITDVFIADVLYILPSALKWMYRRTITRSIQRHKIKNLSHPSAKTTNLFIHQDLNSVKEKTIPTVLILHGDYGHPAAHLNLADVAASQGYAVFSLFLFYRQNPLLHRDQIKQAISTLEQLMQNANKKLGPLVLVGHSRGAVEAAYQGYVDKHPKVTDVISIAGRLRLLNPSQLPCKPALQETVESIWHELKDQKPGLTPRLCQVVALQDCAVDHRTSGVRSENRLEVDTGHCRVLFHPQTIQQISEWLQKKT